MRRGLLESRWSYLVALLVFGAALVFSFRSIGEVSLRWPWVGAAVALVPVGVALSGVEFQMAGRLLDQEISFVEAVRVSLLATAANLLPLPGAVLVRIHALERGGASYGKAIRATGAIGVCWVAAAYLGAAPIALYLHGGVSSGVLLVLGGGALAVTLVLAADSRRPLSWTGTALLLELAFVAARGLRFYAVLRGLGLEGTPWQSALFVVAAVTASLTALVPGGIGIREWMAGLLSPIFRMARGGAILATAVDRLLEIATHALLLSLLMGAGSVREELAGHDGSDARER